MLHCACFLIRSIFNSICSNVLSNVVSLVSTWGHCGPAHSKQDCLLWWRIGSKQNPTRGQQILKEHNTQIQLAADFYSNQTNIAHFPSNMPLKILSIDLTSSPEKNADGWCRKIQAKCCQKYKKINNFVTLGHILKLKVYDSTCEWICFVHHNVLH